MRTKYPNIAKIIIIYGIICNNAVQSAEPTILPQQNSVFLQKFLEKVNNERKQHKLTELTLEVKIQAFCNAYCYKMASGHGMVHSNGPYAENIAMGQNSLEEVMKVWMNSSGHRANILGNYKIIGLAAYKSSNGTWFWCQDFK